MVKERLDFKCSCTLIALKHELFRDPDRVSYIGTIRTNAQSTSF